MPAVASSAAGPVAGEMLLIAIAAPLWIAIAGDLALGAGAPERSAVCATRASPRCRAGTLAGGKQHGRQHLLVGAGHPYGSDVTRVAIALGWWLPN